MDNSEHLSKQTQIEDLGPLTSDVKQIIDNFLDDQIKKSKDNPGSSRTEAMDYRGLLAQSQAITKDSEASTHSNVSILKINDEIAGISILNFTGDKKSLSVRSSFVGVGWNFRNQSVATKLVQHWNDYLNSINISDYPVSVHEGSRNIFKKLARNGEVSIKQNESDPKELFVHIIDRERN